jgi:glycosyltransferase involved in cell wall biosynthesis
MRVLFLTDSLSDLDGVGRYAVRLIAALERLRPDLEVEVLLARKHRPTSAEVPARWTVRVALPPDYFYYMPPWRFWPSAWLAAARVATAAERCDIVHAIKDYPHNYAALRGARRAGKPCIATAHGTYSVLPLLSSRHGRRARWTYRRFAAMIAVSRYTRRRLLEILRPDELDPEHVRVIPNAVSAEHYATPRVLGARPWHATPFTLAIGEVKERKGHHLALAAWCNAAQEHATLHHYIVGKSTGDAYHASLLEIARRAGMSDRVHFLGNISEDEKVDLLQRARVFVHTPVTAGDGGFEGFGIVYLEASACGVPVIGTRDCGAEDAIDDGTTGFLVDQDAAAVERALRRLLADAALRAKLGAAGRERARRSSWEENARAVLALYDEVRAPVARS